MTIHENISLLLTELRNHNLTTEHLMQDKKHTLGCKATSKHVTYQLYV